MYPPVGSGTSSTVSFVVLFLASMGVVEVGRTLLSVRTNQAGYYLLLYQGVLLLVEYSTS